MNSFLVGLSIFISIVLLIEGVFLLFRSQSRGDSRNLKQRLTKLSAGLSETNFELVKKKKPLSKIPWVNDILDRMPVFARLDKLLLQAGLHYPVVIIIVSSLSLAMVAMFLSWVLFRSYLPGLMLAPLGGALPILYILYKREKRVKKFERQLPDALGLMARALKAGHAFTGGLMMVVQEFDDPIAGEFQKVLNEINYGSGVDQSLYSLTERVDCPDLKFFAVSLIVQRETGGNLAEILDKIAELIRDRFKLMDRVKTLSAEGRLSAVILILIPVFVAAVLSFTNPKYIEILITDPFGKYIIATSILMAVAGVFVMKRMVSIEV